MIVFKYFFKILKKYKITIICFTLILILFSAFSLNNANQSNGFKAEKPSISIINNDENIGITKNLCEYLSKNCEVKKFENNEEKIDDALFYRKISYIIYIPENFNNDFMNGNNPKIETKTTGDYYGSYTEMLLNRYLQVANTYLKSGNTQDEIIENIDNSLNDNVEINMTSKLDTNTLAKSTFYFNFANYSIIQICVYVIAMIMSSFRDTKIKKRMLVSYTKNTDSNRSIFMGILVLGITLWAIYYGIGIVLLKDVMLSKYGILYGINSFALMICALAIAFLIGNAISKKDAINGISNVVALGSSFLCGSFVSVEFIPDGVLKFAHILPSYWYIQNNEYIKTLETINLNNLKPYIINLGIILLFAFAFMIISNILSKRAKDTKC